MVFHPSSKHKTNDTYIPNSLEIETQMIPSNINKKMVAAHCRGPIPTPARAVVATNKIYPTHSEAERVREGFTKKVARLLDFVLSISAVLVNEWSLYPPKCQQFECQTFFLGCIHDPKSKYSAFI